MKEQIVTPSSLETGTQPVSAAGIAAEAIDRGREASSALPRDHPAWQRDVLSVSARAREVIAALRPLALRVLTFWDHFHRGVTIEARTLEIDPSGSYRLR